MPFFESKYSNFKEIFNSHLAGIEINENCNSHHNTVILFHVEIMEI